MSAPPYLASGGSLLGWTGYKSTYQGEYPTVTSDLKAALQFDKIMNNGTATPRVPGLNARKVYYKAVSTPSQHWQTSSPTSPQPVSDYCAAGMFCVVIFEPNPAGVTGSGTLNSTGRSEANAMQQTIALWQSQAGPDGTVATNPGQCFVLGNEVNYGGKFSSAAAYITYCQGYGPYITLGDALIPSGYSSAGNAPAAMGYNPFLAAADSGTAVCDYFPGLVGGTMTTVASGSNGGLITQIATWSSPSPGVLKVASTSGYASSGTIWVPIAAGGVAEVAYTGITGTSFTGCTYAGAYVGPATGTIATGGAVGSAPLVSDVYTDFYGGQWDDSGFTSTSSLSANTKNMWALIDLVTPGTGGSGDQSGAAAGCGLGIGEWGLATTVGGEPAITPNFADMTTYLIQMSTGQAVGSKGVALTPAQLRPVIWYSNNPPPTGPNYVDYTSPVLLYLQAFYDATIQAPSPMPGPVQYPPAALMRAATW